MKITCQKEELLRIVGSVGRLATTRATLPILQNIYLSVSGNTLLLKATDLEQTLQGEIKGEGFDDGAITVSARVLTDYLQNNTDKQITLSTDDTTLKIDSPNHKAKVKGIDAVDYPSLPKITFQVETVIGAVELSEAINKIIFSAANDETRPTLTGLLFRFQGEAVQLVATDGYRLGLVKLSIKNSLTGDYILPKRSLQEMLRLLGLGDEAILSFSSSQVQLKIGGMTFISRVLDGAFPTYEKIIPKSYKVSLRMNVNNLLQTLKLASLFSRDSAYSTKFELEKNTLKVIAVSPVLGESSNEITVENGSAEPFLISANAQYLIDALSAQDGDIDLHFIDQKSPIVITSPADDSYLYLVMPLRSE